MLDRALDHAPVATTELRLHTLERLLAIRTTDLPRSLKQAADFVVETFAAEKVDVFLHHAASATLVAEGTSDTPLGREQHRLGLDRLPLANGGSAVRVFQTGEPHLTRQADREGELPGLVDGLGIRSEIIAPVEIGGVRRGVLLASSQQPQYFDEDHLLLLETVARWVGLLAEHSELTQQLAVDAAMRERYGAAEELLAVVAHDLRNHLASLRGRLDLLKRRAMAGGDEDHARDAAMAVVGVDRLGRLVDDLLDAERLERGLFDVRPEALNLVALVREVKDRFDAERVSIEVQAPAEIWLAADPRRVRQALENVVANAVKHSPANGRVTIEVASAHRDAAAGAQVSIQDEGPGVPSELVPRLFERFGRSGSSAGLGLGLFIASRVAQAHGGSLTLDSQPGSPARFTLWLPVTPA
jgi:signal transduction histidine kinase